MTKVVKTLFHPDSERRVLIVQRDSGHYGFEEEKLVDPYEDYERLRGSEAKIWVPLKQESFLISDSAESAEAEARGRVDWLKDPRA
jgi:hypothetical protein